MRVPSIFAACLVAWSGSAAAQLYEFPFKGEDFADDERLYWGRAVHGTGVQEHGFDLDSRTFDENHPAKWNPTKDGNSNKNWLIYGKPVYAMRAGTVIACWRNAPDNPGPGRYHTKLGPFRKRDGKLGFENSRIYGGGNGFWIEHDDGTRAEYAHFAPGSVPTELCPHNDALFPATVDSPNVRHSWPHIRVPNGQRVRVAKGQFLGRVGNAGTSSNPHLHFHVEEGGKADAVKQGGRPVKIRFARGLAAPNTTKPYGKWTSFAGKPIPPGPVVIWAPRSVFGQHARHAYPASRYAAMFMHLADSGYEPSWIDTYRVGKKNFINQLWQPAKRQWRAFHLVSPRRYQQVIDQAIEDGFEPVHVESSRGKHGVLYSIIFAKNVPGSFMARHGLSQAQHEAVLDDAKQRGLSPVSISVVSIGGRRSYTVLYRSNPITSGRCAHASPKATIRRSTTATPEPVGARSTSTPMFTTASRSSPRCSPPSRRSGAPTATRCPARTTNRPMRVRWQAGRWPGLSPASMVRSRNTGSQRPGGGNPTRNPW